MLATAVWKRDWFDTSSWILVNPASDVLARIVPFNHGIMSGYNWTVYGKPLREGFERTEQDAKTKAEGAS